MTRKLSVWMAASLVSCSLLAGCATSSQQTQTASPDDPYENVNRKIYAFNTKVDEWVILPVTKGYRAITPNFAQEGVSNAVSNVGEPNNAVNNLLQGKVNAGIESVFRFLVNSTFGIGGLFDVASWIGMDKHKEDFGRTLATWGVGPGPYLVLPLLGPSGVRDIWSWPVAYVTNPMTYVLSNEHIVGDSEWPAKLGWAAVTVVDARSSLIDSGFDEMRANTIDEYVAVRDAYRRLREQGVHGDKISAEDELKGLTPLVLDDDE